MLGCAYGTPRRAGISFQRGEHDHKDARRRHREYLKSLQEAESESESESGADGEDEGECEEQAEDERRARSKPKSKSKSRSRSRSGSESEKCGQDNSGSEEDEETVSVHNAWGPPRYIPYAPYTQLSYLTAGNSDEEHEADGDDEDEEERQDEPMPSLDDIDWKTCSRLVRKSHFDSLMFKPSPEQFSQRITVCNAWHEQWQDWHREKGNLDRPLYPVRADIPEVEYLPRPKDAPPSCVKSRSEMRNERDGKLHR